MPNDSPSYATSSYSNADLVTGYKVVVEDNEYLINTAREMKALLRVIRNVTVEGSGKISKENTDNFFKEQEIKRAINDILAEIQHIDTRIDEKQEIVKNLRLETQAMISELGEIVD